MGTTGIFAFYYLAAVFAAWYGGWWPGVAATGFAALLAVAIFLWPLTTPELVQLGNFLIVGTLVASLCESLHKARARAAAAGADLQRTLEAAGVGLTRMGCDFRYLNANSAYARLVGLPVDQIVGRHVREVIGDAAFALVVPNFERVLRGERIEYEAELPFAGSGPRFVHVIYAADRDQQGSVVGCVASVADVTERRQAQDALLRSQSMLAAVLDAAPMGVFITDREGRVLRTNPAANMQWGAPPLVQSWKEFLEYEAYWPGTGRRVQAQEWAMARALNTGEIVTNELVECVRFDDQRRWFALNSAAPVRDPQGSVIGGVSLTLDVTTQRLAEQQRDRLLEAERAARQEAEAANVAKDEFLATASHELRTPLNAILGWATLLLRTPRVAVVDVAHEGLTVIQRNARAQAQLIEDILDTSRIIGGRMQLRPEPTDLTEVVRAAVETVRMAAQARHLDIAVRFEPVGPVSADPQRLQQVFWNLLSNAVKFTPKGGKIRVSVSRHASRAVIAVSDSGVGIPGEFLPHVFERFRMADASTTRRFSGLGLGLAIARQLIELHGGTIRVESPGPDRGSTFTVELPVLAVASQAPGQPKHAAESTDLSQDSHPFLNGRRVLVIDDEPDARHLVATVLEHCGMTVFRAESVRDAMDLLSGGLRPDVVVSDIGMPNEDGYAFIAQLRAWESEEIRRLPAAALTAYTRIEDRMRALSAGFDVYIPKPVEPEELVTLVAGIVEGSRTR